MWFSTHKRIQTTIVAKPISKAPYSLEWGALLIGL